MNKSLLQIWKMFSGFAPVMASKIMFYKTNKKRLDLNNPIWFDEKLQKLKLYKYSKDPLASICADKYDVRKYVIENGCGHILNELVIEKAFLDARDIPWDDLPNKFVLKCTHGCKMNIICTDKNKFDIKQATCLLNKWLKEKQWKEQAELHYKRIVPRIIVEKYIDFDISKQGNLPIDYKIYCFNGVAKVILVCSNREFGVKYNYYDLEWNSLNEYIKPELRTDIIDEKPQSLYQMIEYSEKLVAGGDFPFVRVDFYESNGKAIFGELTLTPSGCNDDDYTEYGQIELGKMLKL